MTDKKVVVKTNDIVPAAMTQEQVELVKRTVAKGATNDELALFLYTAKRTGLDPLTRQVHFVKRKQWNAASKGYIEIGTTQTGIDGYRAIAVRTGDLAGIDDAIYDSEEGQNPKKASVTVYRIVHSQRVPFTATARWSEYVSTDRDGNPIAMWKKMPYLMLAKVAEALALRKAFPNDLSGLYTNEEMAQADPNRIEQAEYDQSPVQAEAIPVVTYDEESTPRVEVEEVPTWKKPIQSASNKEKEKNRIIRELADSIVLEPFENKEAYWQYIKENTGLILNSKNLDKIFERLMKLSKGEVVEK